MVLVWCQKDGPVCICNSCHQERGPGSGLVDRGLSPGSAAYQLRKVTAALRASFSSSVSAGCQVTTPLTVVRVT